MARRNRLLVVPLCVVTVTGIVIGAVFLWTHMATHSPKQAVQAPPVATGAAPLDIHNAAAAKATKNIEDFGAICDGVHNDQQALQKAITTVKNGGGGVVEIPSTTCRIVQTASTPSTILDGPVTISGSSAASRLLFDSDKPGEFRSLFRISGANVGLKNLSLARAAGVSGIMLPIWPVDGFSMDNVVIEGNRTNAAENAYMHAITFNGAPGQTIQNVSLQNVTIQNSDYGLLQDSSVKATVKNVSVSDSTFTGNTADDLEFNAPSGIMSNVSIVDSHFSDNKASATGAGFGVGLANVQDVTIARNSFDGYKYEPVHIEDRSSNVLVSKNSFKNTFTANESYASSVFIISGSHNVQISNNDFDTSDNANSVQCVYVGSGGSTKVPHDVQLADNTFKLRKNAKPLGVYSAQNVTTTKSSVLPLP